ncbi:MAG: methylmalonyl Co-A mutase-associated GTPase MeaB [Alphaproteobacteria bacterium]
MTEPSSAAPPALSPAAAAIRGGDRRALARAITLIESSRADHRAEAEALLAELLPHSGEAIRIGISGAPGVGKSTFIEAFGLHAIDIGRRLAVLAVDPSSARSGGSILGDKTRMERLASRDAVYIRPSPARGQLGGVARRTREAMLLCEAAGYDLVMIETVGVGQSEMAVAGMVDLFLLLIAPGGGDELQGVKRGILEVADLVVVTKADGALEETARHTEADYRSALSLMRPNSPHWTPRVMACSALEGRGLEAIWQAVLEHHTALSKPSALAEKRADQARAWLWSEVQDGLIAALEDEPRIAALAASLESAAEAGRALPPAAAREIVNAFLHRPPVPAKKPGKAGPKA